MFTSAMAAWRSLLVLLAGTVAILVLTGGVAQAHDKPVDSQGGHECTQGDVDAGLCEPADSYHCHVVGCQIPRGKLVTKSGGSEATLSPANAAAQSSAPPPSAAPTAVATAAPVVATPTPTTRALGNTGTFTDVLGWTGIAILFFGVALVLFGPPRRRRA